MSEAKPESLQIAQQLMELSASTLSAVKIDQATFFRIPVGHTLQDITVAIEKANPAPARKRGRVVLKDLASLLTYAKDQVCEPNGYIYADPDERTFLAVFNDLKATGQPGWKDFFAEYRAEYTQEFKRWLDNNKQQKGQVEFAEFIEENFVDIAEPGAQVLLDVATTLQAKTDISFSSAKRLDNGQTQMQYVETINATAGAGGALQIPKEFNLGLRIFKNGDGYKLKARLKYRLHSGNVKFWYELDRPERSVEDAFAGYVEKVRTDSGYTVLIGKP